MITRDNARPYAAIVSQRALHIRNVALLIPAAILRRDLSLELPASRVLADHIDRRSRIAGTGQQAVSAAHDLNPFEESHIGKRVAQIPAGFKPGRNAIDHIVVYLKTAGVVTGAVGIRLAAADPHGMLHHIAQGL